VSALALLDGTLYAGGSFVTIGGLARNRIAALNTAVSTFNPNASSTVNVLALAGSTLYAGGFFSTIGGQTLNSLAALSTADGTALPLPVVLTAFTATLAGPGAVRLAWATASEVSSARFEVQRSADGVAYTTIGSLAAAGTSLTPHAYAYPDAGLPAGASRLYYRLRQVDQDGTAAYSPVRPVALTGAAAGLSLYPNPAPGGAATLLGASPEAPVQVFDALGRPVAAATADAAGTAALPGLAPGVYVVRVGQQAVRLTVE